MISNIIIEDGYNTSYLDSLLIALFYSQSNIYNLLLENNPSNINMIYFQELIKNKFIYNIKNCISINKDIINYIRLYLINCGWGNNNDYLKNYRVEELYTFLINNIYDLSIEYKKTLTENYKNNIYTNTICYQKDPFITLNLDNTLNTDLTSLFNNWKKSKEIIDNSFDINNYSFNYSQFDNIINNDIKKFHFSNIIIKTPIILTFYINRFSNDTIYKTPIDIKKKIKIYDDNNITLTIFTIICFDYELNKYYTILKINNIWYIFSNSSIPSIKKIDLKIENNVNKIMKECIFVIYQ